MCVALAIASVLILALTEYTFQQARTQKSQDMSNEFTQIVGILGQAFGNETTCTSLMNTLPVPVVTPAAYPSIGPSPNYIIQTTAALPSGLSFLPPTATAPAVPGIVFGVPVPVGPAVGLNTPEIMPVTITGTKSSTSTTNLNFIGGNTLSKTFNLTVWVTAPANTIAKCVSSQDMAQSAPVPMPTYSPPPVSCAGTVPTCATGTPHCCAKPNSPLNYWACPNNGWDC
jgi:hypothetical protein